MFSFAHPASSHPLRESQIVVNTHVKAAPMGEAAPDI